MPRLKRRKIRYEECGCEVSSPQPPNAIRIEAHMALGMLAGFRAELDPLAPNIVVTTLVGNTPEEFLQEGFCRCRDGFFRLPQDMPDGTGWRAVVQPGRERSPTAPPARSPRCRGPR